MKLDTYLERAGKTVSQFASEIDVSVPATWRYIKEGRVPRSDVVERIYEVTGGAVAPNDFYDLSDTCEEAAPL